MPKFITLDNIDDLAIGSTFLGTGGGGDPYLGALLCKEAIEQYGPVPLISVDELPEDASVFSVAGMGAPTVMIEKLFSVEYFHVSVSALEARLGRTATAIVSAEIGGLNSVTPVAYAAMRQLPIIDGDGMGRAFPSINMSAWNVAGVSCTPMALSDEHSNVVVFDTNSAKMAEDLARPLVAAMGAATSLSCYPMTGTEAKRAMVRETVSAAITIGKAIRSHDNSVHPLDRLLNALKSIPYYKHAYRIFDGKIVDLRRDTSRGWVFGRCIIQAMDGSSSADVNFQNENIAVRVDGVLKAIVPDLVSVVDSETAQPIPAENLRYGQRVTIIGCSAAPNLRTPAALECMGPAAFGEDVDYVEIERLMGSAAKEREPA